MSFLNMDRSRPLFVYFRTFQITQLKYKLIKALLVWLGFEPWAAKW